MAKTYIPYTFAGSSISVYLEDVHIFPSSHLLFKKVVELVKAGNLPALKKLMEAKNQDGLSVKDDVVLYNGEPLTTGAAKKLFELKAAGFDVAPMIKFLENCYKNPYPAVVEKLYEFLESKGMPITEDGCFIGYKYCNQDYFDSYTGKTYKYLPNTFVTMPRVDFHDLSGSECSHHGLHVGNWEYSGVKDNNYNNGLYGRRNMLVKVNPKDVVSVPYGSEAKKIRTWEMYVIKELTQTTDIVDSLVANEEGEADYTQFVVGSRIVGIYKDGDGKSIDYKGVIKNVGSAYIELEAGWKSNTSTKDRGYKVRLKIANLEVM